MREPATAAPKRAHAADAAAAGGARARPPLLRGVSAESAVSAVSAVSAASGSSKVRWVRRVWVLGARLRVVPACAWLRPACTCVCLRSTRVVRAPVRIVLDGAIQAELAGALRLVASEFRAGDIDAAQRGAAVIVICAVFVCGVPLRAVVWLLCVRGASLTGPRVGCLARGSQGLARRIGGGSGCSSSSSVDGASPRCAWRSQRRRLCSCGIYGRAAATARAAARRAFICGRGARWQARGG